MPEIVCTIVVNAASGSTYRAISIERFSAELLDFLNALDVRHRSDVPDVVQNFARVAGEQRREFAVILPGARNRAFVNFAAAFVKEKRFRRHIGVRAIQPHIALALLLRIVKRVRVQKRPDELPADIFEPELKMRVLVNGVMPAVKRRRRRC